MAAARAAPRAAVIRSRRGAKAPRARRHDTTKRRTATSCGAGGRSKESGFGTLNMERAIRRWLFAEEGGEGTRRRPQRDHQDLVAPLYDFSAIRRPHFRRL